MAELREAAKKGDLESVKSLIAEGANVNYQGTDALSLWHSY